MTAKFSAALAAGLLFAAAGRADDAKDVEAALKVLNAAYAADDAEIVRSLMTVDHVAVTPHAGRQTREELLKNLPETKLTEYTPGPMTVRVLAPGSVLVTYSLSQKGTFRGKPVPAKAFAAAIWAKTNGKWREAYYQETAAD